MDEGPRFMRGLAYGLLFAGALWTLILMAFILPAF